MMIAVQPRRILSRRRHLGALIFIVATIYWLLVQRSSTAYRIVGWQEGSAKHAVPPVMGPSPGREEQTGQRPLKDYLPNGDIADKEPPIDQGKAESKDYVPKKTKQKPEPEPEKPEPEKVQTAEEKKLEKERERVEKALRDEFEDEYKALSKQPNSGALFGNTLATLVNKTSSGKLIHEAALKPAKESVGFTGDWPQTYDPYPHYNNKEWFAMNRAEYVACKGPDGVPLDDVRVFKGFPHDFPPPSFGSYTVLDMDSNICFERETRLGPYGFTKSGNHVKDWKTVKWGELQGQCIKDNKARFNLEGMPNSYADGLYGRANATVTPKAGTSDPGQPQAVGSSISDSNDDLKRGGKPRPWSDTERRRRDLIGRQSGQGKKTAKEERTALLIRTYTGKEYSENDVQNIRSLVTELSLRTGGQYQVFLFVQVKDTSYAIWESEETYEWVLQNSVPREFWDMTVLWNDDATQSTYPKLDPKQATVHVAQWLSVQKFSQEFQEFDYIWNWELDSRVTGHHYEFLEKLVSFAKKQPRRGLWERNERYYIPSIHGDYDTDFRKEVESHAVNGSVWGPPDLPFITPIGPKAPVKKPEDDNYEWGVGEEADLVTVAPIFNPVNSSWVGAGDVWGYNDSSHSSSSLPRRATIITQSRVSKRLLDIMHVENLRGNHVSSEMTTQTVALLHGLKAVYAPMPIFFDQPWPGKRLERWFNGGLNGESGGIGSAMGWGREGRFGGSTWYFRADPPQRLYTNWMGWEDTGMGGPDWENIHGRPCLLPMLLHPIKDVVETGPGHSSESKLPYA